MLIPYAEPTAGIHFEISGYGNVAPAPDERRVLLLGRRRAGGADGDCDRGHAGHDEHEPKSSLHDLTLSLDCHWCRSVVPC